MTQPSSPDYGLGSSGSPEGTLYPVMKELYKGQGLEMACFKGNPLLGIVKKDLGFVGKTYPHPIMFGLGSGVSGTFTSAQDYDVSPKLDSWELTHVNDYGYGTISGEAIDMSASKAGSFVRGLKNLVDARLQRMGNRLNASLYRDGYGWLGRVGANSPTTVLTLLHAEDTANFQLGDEVQAVDDASAAGALMDGGDSCTIIAIDRNAGTLTSDVDWDTTIASLGLNDYLCLHGDAYNDSSYKRPLGLMSFIPASAPSGTLMGVNQAADPVRLGGNRLDASDYPTVEEAIIDAASICGQEGGHPDLFLLHPVYFRRLVKELGSKVVYDKLSASGSKGDMASVSFDTVTVAGPTGKVKVVQDRFCYKPYGFCLDSSTLKLCSNGAWPRWLMPDGSKFLRLTGADGLEFRLVGRGNFLVTFPGANCIVTMPTS